jgi:F-type H+-transporting ATPase subunit alpha
MSEPPESLQSVFDHAFAGISRGREAFTPQLTLREVGTITSVCHRHRQGVGSSRRGL